MPPIIELKNVDYYYDRGKPSEVHALQHISLNVEKGEYAAFFGPSGCGKSTLLYAIAGIERPTSGSVLINGRDIMDYSEQELALYRQTGVGIIFQNFNLIPSITVLDNVAMPLAFLGISASVREKKANEICERLGIGAMKDRYPYELSGGQQQRVGIARALANQPPLILADEPLGNLDSENANAVLQYLDEFHEKEGQTVIMVTHEEWSLRGVEKIFHMKDGVIIKVDKQEPHSFNKEAYARKEEAKPTIGVPSAEIRAKVFSQFLLRGYSQEEISRLESFLFKLLNSEINTDAFQDMLDKPWKAGGVGLWRQRAKNITLEISELIGQGKVLEIIYKKILDNPNTNISQEIKGIRKWLLKGFALHLTLEQESRLDKLIGERTKNFIPSQQFVHMMNIGLKFGGVGLRIGTSLHIAEKLETLLGEKTATLKPGGLNVGLQLS